MPQAMKIRDLMRWRIVGLLLAVVVIVGLPYLVTLNNTRDTQNTVSWVVHSNAVKALTYQIAYTVRDSETATYRLLTGDTDQPTRDRAHMAATEVVGLLHQLRDMTRDNADQQVLIGSLNANVSGRIALMNQALGRLEQGDLQGAIAQGLQHLPAIQSGQHDIQDHEVVLTLECQVQPIATVLSQVGHKSGLAQSLAKVFTGFRLIFDDQYLHGHSPLSGVDVSLTSFCVPDMQITNM